LDKKQGGRRRPPLHDLSRLLELEVEAVAELNGKFSGVVPVEAAKSRAVVEFYAAVGYVESGELGGEIFAELFA